MFISIKTNQAIINWNHYLTMKRNSPKIPNKGIKGFENTRLEIEFSGELWVWIILCRDFLKVFFDDF